MRKILSSILSLPLFLGAYLISSRTPISATHFIVTDETADYNHPVINEFFVDGTNEWIELYNPSSQEIDLSSLILDDNGGSSTTYVFGQDPGPTSIPAKSFLVVEDNFGLNDSGDTVRLLDDNENTIDQRQYASDQGTSSVGRVADGGPDFVNFSTPTKGVSNGATLTTLYVDDDWDSPGNDGEHSWGFDAFNSIQEAISFAPAGSTINVASGEYEQEEELVINKRLTLLGDPGDSSIGPGLSPPRVSSCNDRVVSITANEVTLKGFLLDGDGCGIPVVRLGVDVTQVTISDNEIVNGTRGVALGGGSNGTAASGNIIENNNIHANEIGVMIDSGNDNIVRNNNIHSNSDNGVLISNNHSAPTGNQILSNTISDNGSQGQTTGIVVYSASGNMANNNIVSGNGVGIENNDSENFFDATQNYWGHASGPFHEDINSEGQGDSISGMVLFSPFYTDELLTITETIDIGTSDLSSFVENGIFDLPNDEEGQLLVRFLTILQKVEFEAFGDGENDVVMPAGTRVDRADDQEFEWDDLSIQDIDEAILFGFDSDELVEEAIQWGIPNTELEFSQPISISISVGTSLNGQTLNVARSTSGSGGWTSSGVVTPATCTVSNGLCTFQATKASYFAATRKTTPAPAPALSTPSSSTAPSSLTTASAPVCNDQKPAAAPVLLSATPGLNSVTLTWSKAANPVSYYLVNYSTKAGEFEFGNPNVGGADTTSYTVSNLSGGKTYYFKVRAGNGCNPGDFSNELASLPLGLTVIGPAEGFFPGVLGEETSQALQPQIEGTQTPGFTPSPAPAEQSLFAAMSLFLIGLVKSLFGFFGDLFNR